jgi:hypothetical protein
MSDIFREVDEDMRRDKAAAFWRRHGSKVIVVLALVVVATAGWRFYEYRQRLAAEVASSRYEEALKLIREQRGDEAEKVLAEAATTEHKGYAVLSRFRLAAQMSQRDVDAGANAYDVLAADAKVDATMRELATLRAIMLRKDNVDAKDTVAKLTPLAAPNKPWRHQARELLGLTALKSADYETAGRYFDQLVIDSETPQSMRSRAQLYLALVAAGPVTTAP